VSKARPIARGVAVGLVAAVAWLLGPACADDTVQSPCTGIPDGGCPLSHGVACADPACEAVYYCLPNNVWQYAQPCPAHEAGVVPPQPIEDGGSDADAGPSAFDASVDAPPGAFGGPGCEDLESPECSVGLALACGRGCCGCEDLFVCEQGGWTLWGACLDGGVVHGPP
jgi:hypothetical protein